MSIQLKLQNLRGLLGRVPSWRSLLRRDRAHQESDRKGTLYLQVTDLGWRARAVDPAVTVPPSSPIEKAGEADGLSERGTQRRESIFRLAAEGLRGTAAFNAPSAVHVLIDDPDLLYMDTMAELFSTSGPAILHDFGAQHLNCSKVTYGRAAFGDGSSGLQRKGVIAYADMDRINHYLTRLDRLALKVASIVPLPDLLRCRAAMSSGGSCYGAIYVGGYHSLIFLANRDHGTLLARSIAVGAMTLVERLAEANGIVIDEAAKVAKSRDLIADLLLADGGSGIAQSALARALGPTIGGLLADVEETLEFFESQRSSGRPQMLELFGCWSWVNGLDRLLDRRLSIRVRAPDADLFDEFCRLPRSGSLNLLSEAGPNLRIGSMTYSFQDGTVRTSLRSLSGRMGEERRTQERRRLGDRRRGSKRRGGAHRGAGSMLAAWFSRVQASTAGAEQGGEGVGERQYYMLLGLVVVGLGYLAYDQHAGQETQFRTSAISLTNVVGENSGLRQSIIQSERPQLIGGEVDKVLWTEKFLSLARNMNEAMWLTDVYLEVENRSVGGTQVEDKKLVIQGAVLPSTEGHIRQISEYIHRLESDQDNFMIDFRDIVFQGASLDQAQADTVIRFTIQARYDAKKRQEEKKKAQAGGAGDGITGRMQQNIQQREDATTKALGSVLGGRPRQ
jgi:hypothetical protein